MARIDVTRDIAAPAEKVWTVLSDPNRNVEWLTIHDSWKGEPPSEVQVGTTFSEMCTVMGVTSRIDWVVTECTPPSLLKTTGSGPGGAATTFTMSVVDREGGSTASIGAEFSGPMVFGPIAMAIERSARKAVAESLKNLSELVA